MRTQELPNDPDALRRLVPSLGAAGLDRAEADRPPRGRVLRLRLGFNPNSSSVGTTVVVFVWSMIASSAALALAAGVLARRFREDDAPPAPPGPST
jgi:hypothetical protein